MRDKVAYEAYLKSPTWAEKRQAKLAEAGYKCQDCRCDERLEVHHLTYERLGFERLTDLQVLCHWCHMLEHGRAASVGPSAGPTTADLTAERRERERLEGLQLNLIAAALCDQWAAELGGVELQGRSRKHLRAALHHLGKLAEEFVTADEPYLRQGSEKDLLPLLAPSTA